MIFCMVCKDQLLLADKLPATDISYLIAKIGDFKVDEVLVYVKFDLRQGVSGRQLDRICTSEIDMAFSLAESDYIVLRAVALRFGAEKLKFFSAYRRHATLIKTGIVIDTFIDKHFVVSSFIDREYQSLRVCSADMLQRAIDQCQLGDVVYASEGAVPAVANVDMIPETLHETLGFLGFVLNASPCYEVDIGSGVVTEYADMLRAERVLTEQEIEFFVFELLRVLGPKRKTKWKFSLKSTAMSVASVVAGIVLGIGMYGAVRMESRSIALLTKVNEQQRVVNRQAKVESFLIASLSQSVDGSLYARLVDLDETISSGSVMSARFVMDFVEIALLVENERSFSATIEELGQRYDIVSSEFTDVVSNPVTGVSYLQYNVVLR